MKVRDALQITGSLSKPSKMPGWAYGLPAKECKTGGKLQAVPGSVCFDCYALKGCYVFKVVQAAQYKRLEAIRNPLWTAATPASSQEAITAYCNKIDCPAGTSWGIRQNKCVIMGLKHQKKNSITRLFELFCGNAS